MKIINIFPNFGIFCTIMDQLLRIMNVCIDNNVKSDRLDEKIFWYKAMNINIH